MYKHLYAMLFNASSDMYVIGVTLFLYFYGENTFYSHGGIKV